MQKRLFANGWALPLFIGDAVTLGCKLFYKHSVASAGAHAAESVGFLGKIPLLGGAIKGVASTAGKVGAAIKGGFFGFIGKLFPIFAVLTVLMLVLWVLSRMKKGADEMIDEAVDGPSPNGNTNDMNSF